MPSEQPQLTKRELMLVAQEPQRLTSNGLFFRFQVFYREILTHENITPLDGEKALGPLRSMFVEAQTPNEAAYHLQRSGVIVTDVGVGRPVLDPSREVFDKENAAAFLGHETKTIDDMMGDGRLPKKADNQKGNPRWLKGHLVGSVEKLMKKVAA